MFDIIPKVTTRTDGWGDDSVSESTHLASMKTSHGSPGPMWKKLKKGTVAWSCYLSAGRQSGGSLGLTGQSA